jgi:hypothetical protein
MVSRTIRMHHSNPVRLLRTEDAPQRYRTVQSLLGKLAGRPPVFFPGTDGDRNPFLDPVVTGLGLSTSAGPGAGSTRPTAARQKYWCGSLRPCRRGYPSCCTIVNRFMAKRAF